jgi:hypothetical protein
MPDKPTLSERLLNLAICVNSARMIAELLDRGVSDSTLTIDVACLASVHGAAKGISQLLAPVEDQLFELNEIFFDIEKAAP